jgi:hypothetical protein
MAEQTDWFADVAAVLDESTDTPVETEESTSLDAVGTPEETAQAEPEEPSSEQANAEDSDEFVAATAETDGNDAVAEPVPAWESPENPYFAKAQQLEQMQAQARYLVEQAARQRAQELQAQRIKALSDDDPERAIELQQFVSEAQQPIVQHAQRLESEVEFAAKLATVVDEAVKHVVPKQYQDQVYAEVERMMALPGGPDYLQRDLATRTAERSHYEGKILKLERQLAAQNVLKERAANGADTVESGNGQALGFQQRWDKAETFDEAFDAFASTLPT